MGKILTECPECKSKNVHHFYSGNNIYDKDSNQVEFMYVGDYEATQCQDCDWDNF